MDILLHTNKQQGGVWGEDIQGREKMPKKHFDSYEGKWQRGKYISLVATSHY